MKKVLYVFFLLFAPLSAHAAFLCDLVSVPASVTDSRGDLNSGGGQLSVFFLADLDINTSCTLRTAFNFNTSGITADATTSVSAVPLPAAAWLFGSGLVGLMVLARRKNT